MRMMRELRTKLGSAVAIEQTTWITQGLKLFTRLGLFLV